MQKNLEERKEWIDLFKDTIRKFKHLQDAFSQHGSHVDHETKLKGIEDRIQIKNKEAAQTKVEIEELTDNWLHLESEILGTDADDCETKKMLEDCKKKLEEETERHLEALAAMEGEIAELNGLKQDWTSIKRNIFKVPDSM